MKKKNTYKNETQRLVITGVPDDMMNEIYAVCINMNEDRAGVLRPVIRDWLKNQPEKMKTLPKGFNAKE